MKARTVLLMDEASKLTQAIGRNIGSKKGHDEQGFDDLITALEDIRGVLRIAKKIEYGR